MPVILPDDLPAIKALRKANVFVIGRKRALGQRIRPLSIGFLNLMPKKEEAEEDILRLVSSSPLHTEVTFVKLDTYSPKNATPGHLEKFYKGFSTIKNKKFDIFIINGAPVETKEWQEVAYWEELQEIMNWTKRNVTSTWHICWGAMAGLKHHHNIDKLLLDKKASGVFLHSVTDVGRNSAILYNVDDLFYAPHSRNTGVNLSQIENCESLQVLANSEVGPHIIASKDGKQIFILGHMEYNTMTLSGEYFRDRGAGIEPETPCNYFPEDDPSKSPVNRWRSNANLIFGNFLNDVYQRTPYLRREIGVSDKQTSNSLFDNFNTLRKELRKRG